MRQVLVVISDSHAGHKFGLCNPDVTLYDEQEDGELRPYNCADCEPGAPVGDQMQAVRRASEMPGMIRYRYGRAMLIPAFRMAD